MFPPSSPQHELLYHTFGRQSFRRTTANLDLFLRRFNQVQLWVVTEVCLCGQLSKRVQLLKKFIKIAAQWVEPAAGLHTSTYVKSLLLYIGLICSRIHFMSWVCLFVHSCREFKNLNSFFAIIMGMSNPAVSRLSQTWEVNILRSASRSLLNLKCFPLLLSTAVKSSIFSLAETPNQVQEVLCWVWEYDGELREIPFTTIV